MVHTMSPSLPPRWSAEPRAHLAHLLQLNAVVITFECASGDGRDLELFAQYKTDKKIDIGVVNHCNTIVEPAEPLPG
jgi:methionine synthase II (cobalamin-independent)